METGSTWLVTITFIIKTDDFYMQCNIDLKNSITLTHVLLMVHISVTHNKQNH